MKLYPLFAFLTVAAVAQQAPPEPPAPTVARTKADTPASYVLGPGDEISVKVMDVEEIKDGAIRVDMQGDIRLPLVGKVHAIGLSPEDLESVIRGRLKAWVKDPDVIVSVNTYRSQPIMIMGAVGTPGVHQIEGNKSLFEVISTAGGLRQDAGYSIKVTRLKEWGRIPLPGCVEDPTGQFYIADIAVKSVMDAKNPSDNVQVKPHDVITVPRVQAIYVIGAVKKSGGYTLGDSESMTVLQALALADGLDRLASPSKARIMRVTPGSTARTEIPIDLKKILAGKGNDVALGPDDMLFIPTSGKKAAGYRTLDTAIGLSGTAIMRLP